MRPNPSELLEDRKLSGTDYNPHPTMLSRLG